MIKSLLEGLAALAFQPKVATDMLRMLMNFWSEGANIENLPPPWRVYSQRSSDELCSF